MIILVLFATMNLDFELIGDAHDTPFQLIASEPLIPATRATNPVARTFAVPPNPSSTLPSRVDPISTRGVIRYQRHQRLKISRCQNGRCAP